MFTGCTCSAASPPNIHQTPVPTFNIPLNLMYLKLFLFNEKADFSALLVAHRPENGSRTSTRRPYPKKAAEH